MACTLGHSKQDDVHCFCTLIDTNLLVDVKVTMLPQFQTVL